MYQCTVHHYRISAVRKLRNRVANTVVTCTVYTVIFTTTVPPIHGRASYQVQLYQVQLYQVQLYQVQLYHAPRLQTEKSFFILEMEIVQLCPRPVLPHETSAQNCAGFEAKQKSQSSWTHSNPGTWKRWRFLKLKSDGLPLADGSGKV